MLSLVKLFEFNDVLLTTFSLFNVTEVPLLCTIKPVSLLTKGRLCRDFRVEFYIGLVQNRKNKTVLDESIMVIHYLC